MPFTSRCYNNAEMRIRLIFLSLALVISSCEQQHDSAVDVGLATPYVISASTLSTSINLDDTSLTSHVVRLGNGSYEITDTITASVESPLGPNDIQSVSYKLYAPGSTQYFGSGALLPTGVHPTLTSVEYRATISFTVERSDVGKYGIEIIAVNSAKYESNASILSLNITRNNSRPTTSGLTAPDTLARPTTGFELIKFSMSASDSDGYGDLQQVFLKRISPTASSIISLYDDGDEQGHGDLVAGDGIFSRVLSIDNTAILGDQIFLFQAKDKSGALSDSLLHTITIVQGP